MDGFSVVRKVRKPLRSCYGSSLKGKELSAQFPPSAPKTYSALGQLDGSLTGLLPVREHYSLISCIPKRAKILGNTEI